MTQNAASKDAAFCRADSHTRHHHLQSVCRLVPEEIHVIGMYALDPTLDMNGKGAVIGLFHQTPVTAILKDHLLIVADMQVRNLHGLIPDG